MELSLWYKDFFWAEVFHMPDFLLSRKDDSTSQVFDKAWKLSLETNPDLLLIIILRWIGTFMKMLTSLLSNDRGSAFVLSVEIFLASIQNCNSCTRCGKQAIKFRRLLFSILDTSSNGFWKFVKVLFSILDSFTVRREERNRRQGGDAFRNF